MTSAITLATDWALPTEPCFSLSELNKVFPIRGDGLRRMQIIQVIRNDKVWTYQRDLGPARKFKTEEFSFPGAVSLGNGRFDVLETVERLQMAAEEYRAKYDKPTPRSHPPQDLVKGFEEYATRRRDARRGRMHFSMYRGKG